MSLFDGQRIWCRDGSSDPVERQAEIFAAALLIPKDRLRAALHLIVAGWIMGLIQAVRLLIPETDTYLASTETLFAGGYLAFAGFCLSLKRWLPKLRRRLTGGKGRGAVSAEESA